MESRDFFVRRAREIVRRNFAIFQSYVAGSSYVKWWNTKSAAFAYIYIGGDAMKLAEEIFDETGVLVNPGERFETPSYPRAGLGWVDKRS